MASSLFRLLKSSEFVDLHARQALCGRHFRISPSKKARFVRDLRRTTFGFESTKYSNDNFDQRLSPKWKNTESIDGIDANGIICLNRSYLVLPRYHVAWSREYFSIVCWIERDLQNWIKSFNKYIEIWRNMNLSLCKSATIILAILFFYFYCLMHFDFNYWLKIKVDCHYSCLLDYYQTLIPWTLKYFKLDFVALLLVRLNFDDIECHNINKSLAIKSYI